MFYNTVYFLKYYTNKTAYIDIKENNIQSYRLRGFQVPQENDYLDSRKVVLTNADCNIETSGI